MIKIMYTEQRVLISRLESPKPGYYLAESNKLTCDNVYGQLASSHSSLLYVVSFEGNSGWIVKFRTLGRKAGR